MPDSPCVDECCLDADDVCVGCGRTRSEIASWSSLSDEERREVLERLSERS